VAASREKKRNDDDKKKLTRVISTKLSIDNYIRFEKCTNFVYQAGMNEEPNTSKFYGLLQLIHLMN
jgi:hypothetical protein